MPKKIAEIDVDLDSLMGFEIMPRSVSRVVSYVNRTLHGEVAPAVDVVEGEGGYCLKFGCFASPSENVSPQYGGHHRCVSAIIVGKDRILANLFDGHGAHLPQKFFSPIKDITLFSGFSNLYELEIARNFPEDVLLRLLSRCPYDIPFSLGIRECADIVEKYDLRREHFL